MAEGGGSLEELGNLTAIFQDKWSKIDTRHS
jgi:hypothetical protein